MTIVPARAVGHQARSGRQFGARTGGGISAKCGPTGPTAATRSTASHRAASRVGPSTRIRRRPSVPVTCQAGPAGPGTAHRSSDQPAMCRPNERAVRIADHVHHGMRASALRRTSRPSHSSDGPGDRVPASGGHLSPVGMIPGGGAAPPGQDPGARPAGQIPTGPTGTRGVRDRRRLCTSSGSRAVHATARRHAITVHEPEHRNACPQARPAGVADGHPTSRRQRGLDRMPLPGRLYADRHPGETPTRGPAS